ncbi:MAG: UDP-2,3-diacylglucosamine diphosphatase LpxI [Algisphaera sp.]
MTALHPSNPPLGLIAGHGDLPLLTAQGMRDAGHRVIAVGFSGQYNPGLHDLCEAVLPVGVLRIGEWSRKLRKHGVTHASMVGAVNKSQLMYQGFWKRVFIMRPDWHVGKLWYQTLRHDRRSQTLLTAVAKELAHTGIQLINTTQYIPDHLAAPGVMTQTQPNASQRAAADFGWPILMRMNELEVGQAIAVRDQDVTAVEAVEGTDAMIQRAGKLCRGGGWTLLKGAGSTKDLRFDVPTVGVQTIENLKAAGAGCVVLDAGRVILVNKPDVIAAADAAGIAIVGR